MAAAVGARLRLSGAWAWLDWLSALITTELAPSRRRITNSVRLATIATVGAGIMAACHVDTQLGPYIIWLSIGASPMLSLERASIYVLAIAPVLAASVPVSGILSETPWLMLPFIAAFTAFTTQQIAKRKLGSFGLVLQVVTLDTFYAVMFDPGNYGWGVSAVFGASVIAFFLISAFDLFLWPDPAEALLLKSIGDCVDQNREQLLKVARYYLYGGERPPEPSIASTMPAALALLNNAAVEGMAPHRRAVLLASASREELLRLEIANLTIWAREDVPRTQRILFRAEIERIVAALAAALEELEREVRSGRIRTGPDSGPSKLAAQIRFEPLDRRIAEQRTILLRDSNVLEIGNFNAFVDTLHTMAQLIERPLDEPPLPQATPASHPDEAPEKADLVLWRYSGKVALCMVIGFVIGLTTQQPNLSTILTTVIITALPTYGAAARKMVLRLVGTLIGSVVTILAIVIVTPNFTTLPVYLIVTFMVLLVSGYASLSSGRVAYAGKSIGTTFLLVFAGLSPSLDIYSPLWRLWGILLGTLVVTVIFFLLWPEYAGDSLIPRLLKALRASIVVAPGGSSSVSEPRIHAANHELTQLFIEILQVADDARIEGRKSLIDPDSLVYAASMLRRIAHRLSALSMIRLLHPLPPLDEATEAANRAVLTATVAQLQSWVDFFESSGKLDAHAARARAASNRREQIANPLEEFGRRLEAGNYAQFSSWSVEQRREMLARLQSLRRLEFLMSRLNQYLAQIPGPASAPQPSLALQTAQ
ncbi:MAG TPA: FUSC family protein [Candidatus Binataceae bacterium]|nr:FUSC family protein [Candidatus Binataceae bacterium]